MSTMSGFPNDFWDLLQCLVEIGAPTGQEGKRVDFIQSWLQKQTRWPINRNAEDCRVLDLRASDQKGARVPLLDAHVDTVFPDLHLSIRKEEAYWHAPGISDNTTSVALLMILARALHTTGQ